MAEIEHVKDFNGDDVGTLRVWAYEETRNGKKHVYFEARTQEDWTGAHRAPALHLTHAQFSELMKYLNQQAEQIQKPCYACGQLPAKE